MPKQRNIKQKHSIIEETLYPSNRHHGKKRTRLEPYNKFSNRNDYDTDGNETDDNDVSNERVDQNTNVGNDDDDDDVVVDDVKKSKSSGNDVILLPGGSGITDIKQNLSFTNNGIGEASRDITFYIREYIDILFSSVMLEAKNIVSKNLRESIYAIPGVVSAILEYNNISFKTILLSKTKISLHEPIWYYYNILKSELCLFVNERFYDNFCIKNGDKPVIFSGGVISIEMFNPYETNPIADNLDLAMIHCAIACDHVAQHIITDILIEDKFPCSDIHDKYVDAGTTLHSIFRIEQNNLPVPKTEYCNYLTLGTIPSRSTIIRPSATNSIVNSLIGQLPENNNNFHFKI